MGKRISRLYNFIPDVDETPEAAFSFSVRNVSSVQ